jgi:hypothetical protein
MRVSSNKYYKNIQILRHTMCLPSYRHKTFPTQIFRNLLPYEKDEFCVSQGLVERRTVHRTPGKVQGQVDGRQAGSPHCSIASQCNIFNSSHWCS